MHIFFLIYKKKLYEKQVGDQTPLLKSEMSSKFWAHFGSKNDKDL